MTDQLPVTPAHFLMPASSAEPFVIHIRTEALTMAVVGRAGYSFTS